MPPGLNSVGNRPGLIALQERAGWLPLLWLVLLLPLGIALQGIELLIAGVLPRWWWSSRCCC